MITEAGLQAFFASRARVMKARERVPSPFQRFSRYLHHDIRHVCPHARHLPFDSDAWIEVIW